MTATNSRVRFANPNATLAALIDDLGLFRVLVSATKIAVRRGKPRPMPADALNDHLRRDIGLAPHQPPPSFRGPVF